MNKSKIILITILITGSFIGIISMQVNWILHDYHLKEQQFNQRANDALMAVANKLEKKEVYNIISNSFVAFNNDSIYSLLREKRILDEQQLEKEKLVKNHLLGSANDSELPTVPPAPPSPPSPPVPPELIDPPLPANFNKDEIRMVISHMGGRRIVIRHNRQVLTIDDSTKTTEHNSIESEALRNTILEKQKSKIEAKINNWNKVVQNMAFEFITDEKDIESRINPTQLDSAIRTELSSRGIETAYHFGVINVGENNIMSTDAPVNKKEILSSRYKTDLFPNDLLAKPVLLSVYFPDSFRYVLSTMWVMLISSSLFIIIMLMGTAYTIYILFRQKKISDIKTDFINNMTHEFKTPIATISLASDAAGNPLIAQNPDAVHRYLNIIKEENQRMHNHVESILQMALLDKKGLNLQLEKFNLHDLLTKAASQFKLQVESKGGKIELYLNAAQSIITGDQHLIYNSIVNLLDNANKYSPEKPEIIITTTNIHNSVQILVKDNGIGMSKEVQKNIFEKFYRATTGNLHDVKGFGLGLSFAKAIIQAHQGEICVLESSRNAGTTMEVLLPIQHNEKNKKFK
ncbi:MAG: HAMP domain-containing histidine kinase [Bacteroidetes bacterium]|nr:HAMP domain-containing histidine kinase [Bacteroidota bacterium]